MNKPGIRSLLCLVLASGCTEGPAATSSGSTLAGMTSGSSETGGAPTGPGTTSGSSETGELPTGSGTTGSSPDAGVGGGECDPWAQDCPAGFKCMAFAEEGEPAFMGDRCTAVVNDPKQEGDPCTVEDGWWTGIDDCDYGLVCWDVNQDTNTGHCVAMCTGTMDAYDCPAADDVCVFWVPGISHVCLTRCDPLIQDCEAGQSCLPEYAVNAAEWVCKAEYSFDEGQEFDDCTFANTCDPGLLCFDPSLAPECAGAQGGCCLSICDLGDPQCDGQGAECQSFYGFLGGEAPPEFADVGLCAVPG